MYLQRYGQVQILQMTVQIRVDFTKELKSSSKLRNACNRVVWNILTSCVVSKNVKNNIHY